MPCSFKSRRRIRTRGRAINIVFAINTKSISYTALRRRSGRTGAYGTHAASRITQTPERLAFRSRQTISPLTDS